MWVREWREGCTCQGAKAPAPHLEDAAHGVFQVRLRDAEEAAAPEVEALDPAEAAAQAAGHVSQQLQALAHEQHGRAHRPLLAGGEVRDLLCACGCVCGGGQVRCGGWCVCGKRERSYFGEGVR